MAYGSQVAKHSGGVLILNPASGGGRAAARLREAMATLDFTVRETTGPSHATELAEEACREGVGTLAVAGGDGTLFEVVNGLMRHSKRPALAVLPVGSGNSFIRDFKIFSADDTLRALRDGSQRPADVLTLSHTQGQYHFANLCSLGFSACVAATTNARFKFAGALGYALGVGAELKRYAPAPQPAESDVGPFGASALALLTISNSQCTGGAMRMAPQADPSDGRFDVIEVGALSRLALLRAFPRLYRGTHTALAAVRCAQATELRFTQPKQQPVMLDGEVFELSPERIDITPSALQVFSL